MKLSFIPLLALGFHITAGLVPAEAAEGDLKKATFCHGVNDDQSPKDTAEFFLQTEPIFHSLELKGRPTSCVVAAKFMLRDDLIAEAKVVAALND